MIVIAAIPCSVSPYRANDATSPDQAGQALVEGLLILMILSSLWVGVAWLGHLQDIALSAQHASRHAAFSFTRHADTARLQHISDTYFSGPAHQWADRGGRPLLDPDTVQLSFDRRSVLHQAAQPGGREPKADSLRRNWHVQDEGIVSMQVRVAPAPRPAGTSLSTFAKGLNDFNVYPVLHRHTAILTGSGHASSDMHVQQIVAQSPLAWHDSASASYSLGNRIDGVMAAVDAPWQRERPVFDWLGPWAGDVPADRLTTMQRRP